MAYANPVAVLSNGWPLAAAACSRKSAAAAARILISGRLQAAVRQEQSFLSVSMKQMSICGMWRWKAHMSRLSMPLRWSANFFSNELK